MIQQGLGPRPAIQPGNRPQPAGLRPGQTRPRPGYMPPQQSQPRQSPFQIPPGYEDMSEEEWAAMMQQLQQGREERPPLRPGFGSPSMGERSGPGFALTGPPPTGGNTGAAPALAARPDLTQSGPPPAPVVAAPVNNQRIRRLQGMGDWEGNHGGANRNSFNADSGFGRTMGSIGKSVGGMFGGGGDKDKSSGGGGGWGGLW